MQIHETDSAGYWTGKSREFDGDEPPSGWSKTPLPEIPENAWARMRDGGWDVTSTPPLQSVTMRQARLALLQRGLLSEVEALIAGLADDAARIEWEYATEVWRDNPLFIQAAGALGLSEQQIDQLFLAAAAL
jgi:hypothetical protein